MGIHVLSADSTGCLRFQRKRRYMRSEGAQIRSAGKASTRAKGSHTLLRGYGGLPPFIVGLHQAYSVSQRNLRSFLICKRDFGPVPAHRQKDFAGEQFVERAGRETLEFGAHVLCLRFCQTLYLQDITQANRNRFAPSNSFSTACRL